MNEKYERWWPRWRHMDENELSPDDPPSSAHVVRETDYLAMRDERDALKAERDLLQKVVDAWLAYDAEEADVALRRYQLNDAINDWGQSQKGNDDE